MHAFEISQLINCRVNVVFTPAYPLSRFMRSAVKTPPSRCRRCCNEGGTPTSNDAETPSVSPDRAHPLYGVHPWGVPHHDSDHRPYCDTDRGPGALVHDGACTCTVKVVGSRTTYRDAGSGPIHADSGLP